MIEPDQLTDAERKLWANVLLQAQTDLSGRDPSHAPRAYGFLREMTPSEVSSGSVITYRWSPMPHVRAYSIFRLASCANRSGTWRKQPIARHRCRLIRRNCSSF